VIRSLWCIPPGASTGDAAGAAVLRRRCHREGPADLWGRRAGVGPDRGRPSGTCAAAGGRHFRSQYAPARGQAMSHDEAV